MKWTWQLENFPYFKYTKSLFIDKEAAYLMNVGRIRGIISAVDDEEVSRLRIEILSDEAISTSKIEGETLDRASVQSSLQRQFGLLTNRSSSGPKESGIAQLMSDVYLNFSQPLDKSTLSAWHKMVSNGRSDLDIVGDYRKHKEAMQIVSGNITNPRVYYEAPPSDMLPLEMKKYLEWFNYHAKRNDLSVLAFAGIAHLYFEILHPFEDGNGRIGRAIVEKALSLRNNNPTLNSFSRLIEKNKKAYYAELLRCNHTLHIDSWLEFFTDTILKAQEYSFDLILFTIKKKKFFLQFAKRMNERQTKVVTRIFEEGLEGFKGELSSSNYQRITKTSPATATRDLADLVDMGAMTKVGTLKSSRYIINLEL